MDLDKLLNALENKSNENLMDFNSEKLKLINKKILDELNITPEEKELYYNKLLDYKYIDEMSDLKYCSYIRWISLENPKINLHNGARFCKFIINEKGTYLLLKLRERYFNLSLDKNLIFQKLTNQEKILLSALDYLS